MMSDKTQTIDSWLSAHALHQPNNIALNFADNHHTYDDLDRKVKSAAAGLALDFGLQRGDRIALYGKNCDAQIVLFFAAARLGLIVVPLNWRLAPKELNFMVADCGAKALFHDDSFSANVPEVLDSQNVHVINLGQGLEVICKRSPKDELKLDAQLRDPFLIVYTSGTTGRPKGAVLTQEAVLWNALSSLHAHDFTSKDHVLNLLPLFHVGGINIQVMPMFFVGGQVTLHDVFEPDTAINALSHNGITSTVCVPTVMNALLDHSNWSARSFPSLRLINTGSTDVPVEILEAVHERGITMVQVYGATETGPIATYQKADESRTTLGSIGRCGIHTQVSTRRPDGSRCEVNEAGEIWVKGPNNFSHYWNNQEETENVLVDGWFKTGDVARQDEAGLFWFADRTKHVIISGGENIYPAELERILNRLPGIREASIVGRPDPKWGEVPVAVVVADPKSCNKEKILAAFTDEIARFKHPKDVIFVDALPRTALGKVLPSEVKKLAN